MWQGHPIRLGTQGPHIHSLIYVDDLIICGKATQEEACKIKDIIQDFCLKSDQLPNWAKSSIYCSRHVPQQIRDQFLTIFPVQILDPSTIHLGHPLVLSHSERTKAYSFILNKFKVKLTTVKANKLNHVGRLTYINYVFASIPIYYMSNIIFTKKFLAKLNAIIINFWWVGIKEEQATSPTQLLSCPERSASPGSFPKGGSSGRPTCVQ
jgi:hypothetical protein